MLIGAGLVLLYAFFGGFVAVALVDMLQGLLIAIVAIVLPVAAFLMVGGVDGITTALAAAPPAYSDVFGGVPDLSHWGSFWGFPPPGLAHSDNLT